MKKPTADLSDLSSEWTQLLGARRAALLRRIMRKCNLPPEVVIDLALEILDIASRKLAPSPVNRQAIGLGTARWRNIDPEQRSEIMRRAVQARWTKQRKERPPSKSQK